MGQHDVVDGKRKNIYLPNRFRSELGIPEVQDRGYEEEIPFDKFDFKEMQRKFEEKFANEIAYLKQWFEVEVKTGYVTYCS